MLKTLSFITLLSISAHSAAEMKTVSLAIAKMTCPACPFIIERSLSEIKGVSEVSTDNYQKTATVTFDDNLSSIEQLTQATKNVGYLAELIKE